MSGRVLEAALNGLWQGALLAACMGVAMRLVGARVGPVWRHGLWWLTLLLVALLPILAIVSRHEAGGAVRVSGGADAPASRGPSGDRAVAGPQAGKAVHALTPAGAAEEAVCCAGGTPVVATARALALPAGAAAIASLAYAGILLVLLARLAHGHVRLCRLRRTLRLPGEATRRRIAAVRAASGVRRTVRIGVTDALAVPATLGFVRPVILLPATLEGTLDAAELDQVVLHELAHVARRDDWTSLAERLLGTLLFFQPAAFWIGRRIALEREHACDEWVVERGGGRAAYARCLVRVAESVVGARRALPAGVLSMASRLADRIERVLAPLPRARRMRPLLGVLVALPLGFTVTLAAAAPRVHVAPPALDPPPATAASSAPSNGVARAEALLRGLEAAGFHGAVLIARGPDVVLRAGYGLADRTRGVPFDAALPFNGGAVAKLLTAAAVLKLEEEGRLRVTDAVAVHLGPFPAAKSAVTIHHLLTHTAGLARAWAPVQREDRAAFIEAMKATPAEYAPGAGHRYTDHGHALLAALIEVVSGEPYEAYVRRTLLVPAGMRTTRFESEQLKGGRQPAVEYVEPAGDGSRVGARPYVWGRRGAMGVVTTLDDLWRFQRAFEDGRLLGEASRRKMLTGYTDAGRFTRIGYGWEVGQSERGTSIRHRLSAWNNSSVEIAYDADEDLFVALVANAPTNWARPKYLDVIAAVLGRPHLQMPAPAALPHGAVAALEGTYTLPSGAVLTVRPDPPGRLRVDTENASAAEVLTHDRAQRASVVAQATGTDRFAVVQWHRHAALGLTFDPVAGTLSIPGIGTAVRTSLSRETP